MERLYVRPRPHSFDGARVSLTDLGRIHPVLGIHRKKIDRSVPAKTGRFWAVLVRHGNRMATAPRGRFVAQLAYSRGSNLRIQRSYSESLDQYHGTRRRAGARVEACRVYLTFGTVRSRIEQLRRKPAMPILLTPKVTSMANVSSLTPPSTREKIGANLIIARARARLTQARLARAAGVTRQTVSDIERGATNATVDVLDELAKALTIPIEQLFAPGFTGFVDDDEINRRRVLPRTERVNARALHAAIEEATGRSPKGRTTKKRPHVRG